jgi:PIN domain nuclease of toxin-antitoxin system
MNNPVVADTMAVVLRLEGRRLPQRVRLIFAEAEEGERGLCIPVMVLAEIGYLSERGRIEATLHQVTSYCATHPTIEVLSLTQEIITHSFEIDDIPELHDRMIAGTAYTRQLPLITNDPIISDSHYVTVIW